MRNLRFERNPLSISITRTGRFNDRNVNRLTVRILRETTKTKKQNADMRKKDVSRKLPGQLRSTVMTNPFVLVPDIS